MKTTYKCKEPRMSVYWNYSKFSQKYFQSDLLLNIGDGTNNYVDFLKLSVITPVYKKVDPSDKANYRQVF